MSRPVTFPAWLEQIDVAKIDLKLAMTEEVSLPPLAMLQLRRELSAALKDLESQRDQRLSLAVKDLLFPPVSKDPVVMRQVQKPSPAVIFSPDCSQSGVIKAGEKLVLPALFIGNGVTRISDLVSLLQVVGGRGLYHGQGKFVVDLITEESIDSQTSTLFSAGDLPNLLTPTVVPLSWWLEQQGRPRYPVMLEIITPMRLIKMGKPLFKLTFNDFFPFVLRRISSFIFSHGSPDIAIEHKHLLELAARVECLDDRLRWQDWRRLERGRAGQDLGGLVGTLILSGEALEDLFWLLQLGALMNVGKGAAYGFGQFRLSQA